MAQDFDGRVVLITGAGRGLGRATAERFLERGAQVAVNVRTPERAETLAHELSRNSHPAPGDIRSAPAVRALVADIVQRFGRLDILVNNAAIASATRIEQLSEDEWRATIDTNLTAAFFCIQAVVPAMKSQSHGRIINVSSLAGRSVSTLGGAHYTASKAGMLGLTRAVAKGNSLTKPSELFPESLVWAIVSVFVIGIGSIFGLMAMMKKLLNFNEGWIIIFTLLIFLLMIVVEGVLIWQLSRQKSNVKEASEIALKSTETKELGTAQARALAEPMLSVTEQTTRTFEPIYSERQSK